MSHQVLIGIFYSQIVERSSLVSILFREAISHPYISFFSFTSKCFLLLKSVRVHFAPGKIAITFEILGQFPRFLDLNERHGLPVLLIYRSWQLNLEIES